LVNQPLTSAIKSVSDCEKKHPGYRRVGDAFDRGGLSAGDVTGYVLAECQRGPISYTKVMSSPLRGLLRFLFVEGLVERDLSGAMPSAPDRPSNSLPKAVSAADVARLLASCAATL
jgi:integrase/recombinase XerD